MQKMCSTCGQNPIYTSSLTGIQLCQAGHTWFQCRSCNSIVSNTAQLDGSCIKCILKGTNVTEIHQETVPMVGSRGNALVGMPQQPGLNENTRTKLAPTRQAADYYLGNLVQSAPRAMQPDSRTQEIFQPRPTQQYGNGMFVPDNKLFLDRISTVDTFNLSNRL